MDLVRLDGGDDTLILVLGQSAPVIAYWGGRLSPDAERDVDPGLLDRAISHGMLDGGEVFDLFPEAGRGFTGRPALDCRRADGAFVTQLAFSQSRPVADGCEIHLEDVAAGVRVTLSLVMDAATGVVGFRTRVTNAGASPLGLDWVSVCALPAPGDDLMAFDGRWAREFRTTRQRLGPGAFVQENRTGRTSHHAPPFLAAGEPGFSDHTGEVWGIHLAWSGDHRLLAERLRDGRVQVQAGELFWPGEVELAPGEHYETPWLYAARSGEGLNGLSRRLHPFVRRAILGGRLQARPRPVHFNTWEAVYFRHDQAELMALADTAAQVGAERFVLDDGWFRRRNDDRAALGDWTADPVKYPQGLRPLVDHVRGLGMQFGLWVEPEMANSDSDLLRAHPDWILGVPGRQQPLGRGQYVLDLTRPEVALAIFEQLDALLRDLPIAYLKWDMNRDLTHPASGGRPASRRQTLALYALIDRVRAAHPDVEIESCASGGGRADYEILKRTERIWTSDCNDPFERQSIQRGFSIFFPPEVMGAHVGPANSHTTARTSRLEFRIMTALFGHMGIEADIRAFSPRDLEGLRDGLALYKRLRELLHGGRTVRQVHDDPGAVATLVVGPQGAVASFAQVGTPTYSTLAPLRLVGLEAETSYRVILLNPPRRPTAAMKHVPALVHGEPLTVTGALLRITGLPLPILRAGEIAVFHLERA